MTNFQNGDAALEQSDPEAYLAQNAQNCPPVYRLSNLL